MLDQRAARELLAAAKEARRNAYAPYSGFAVGAALLDSRGAVHTGVNVENAAYGLSTCAERSAIAGAVGRGVREFQAIAVAGPDDDAPCPPCGSCRQVLYEFAPELEVVLADGAGEPRRVRLQQLLPDAFGALALGERRGDGS